MAEPFVSRQLVGCGQRSDQDGSGAVGRDGAEMGSGRGAADPAGEPAGDPALAGLCPADLLARAALVEPIDRDVAGPHLGAGAADLGGDSVTGPDHRADAGGDRPVRSPEIDHNAGAGRGGHCRQSGADRFCGLCGDLAGLAGFSECRDAGPFAAPVARTPG